MGSLMFGKDETLTCVQDIALKGASDEPLCLAFKTSKYFVGAGVYLKDDGYVLRSTTAKDTYYPMPEGAELKAFQAQGLMPDPLPPYSVPAVEYLFGYSLWLVVGLVIGFERFKTIRTRKRQAKDAATPVSFGPPTISTEGDRFIAQTVGPLLRPGEQVQHQAYGQKERAEGVVAAARNVGLFGVLTNQRLIFVKTKIGAFKPVLENHGVDEVPREAIVDAVEDDYLVTFMLHDGTARTLLVPPQEKHFSNQRAFIRDVPRILGNARQVEAQPQVIG
jgi:hypothetical protein